MVYPFSFDSPLFHSFPKVIHVNRCWPVWISVFHKSKGHPALSLISSKSLLRFWGCHETVTCWSPTTGMSLTKVSNCCTLIPTVTSVPRPLLPQAAPSQWLGMAGSPVLGKQIPLMASVGSRAPQWLCWTFLRLQALFHPTVLPSLFHCG